MAEEIKVVVPIVLGVDDSQSLIKVLEYIVNGPGRKLVRSDIHDKACEALKGLREQVGESRERAKASAEDATFWRVEQQEIIDRQRVEIERLEAELHESQKRRRLEA